MANDLNAIAVFVVVAEARNFRAASEVLGVTASAVSQSIQRLESRLGTALFHRTTRSVRLTETGERFLGRVLPAVHQLDSALEEMLDDDAAHPSGRLRLAVSSIAERFIDGPLLASFLRRFPDVELDISITDDEFDIVSHGFDAGVRLGEVLDLDMVAVPASTDQRQVVVGSPEYFERYPIPGHPEDLSRHRCIGWRRTPDLAPYRWEFNDAGREFAVQVPSSLTTNDMWLMLRTALAGGGLTFGMRDTFEPYLEDGRLVAVLEKYSKPFPGFFLYFPNRRHLAPRMRALVNHVREFKS